MCARIADPSPQKLIELVEIEARHTFKHAATDDNTGLLYAWSRSTEVETLRVWRFDVVNGKLEIVDEGQQYYESVSHCDFAINWIMLSCRRERTETSKRRYSLSTAARDAQSGSMETTLSAVLRR